MSRPTIHGPNFSTYVRTVRLALEEKGIDYDLHEVNILAGAHMEPEHRARHPFAKVPTFSHDGTTIYETSAIIRYIDRAFPGISLQPTDPKVAAHGDQVICVVDSVGYGSIIGKLVWQRMVTPMLGGTPDDTIVAGSLDMVRLCVSEFDRLLGHGPWFGADVVSLADLHLAPVFAYMMGTDEGREIASGHHRISAWWQAMSTRDSMRATEPKFG